MKKFPDPLLEFPDKSTQNFPFHLATLSWDLRISAMTPCFFLSSYLLCLL